jgi:hypothetical protein
MRRRARKNPDSHEIVQVAPEKINPPHLVTDRAKYRSMIEAFEQSEDWEGRPLLVEERGDGTYQAWTGSHRIAAARVVWVVVPVVVIDREALDRVHGQERPGLHFDRTGSSGSDGDQDRIEYLEAAGDAQAAALMQEEVGESRENPFVTRILRRRR